MRAFKEKKKQIQAGDKRRQEDERCIMIPVPKRFYCMEHKIYETPQDFNEEMNRRIHASERVINASERIKNAYETGRKETAREILQEFMTKISSFTVTGGLSIIRVDINIDFVKNLVKKYGLNWSEIWKKGSNN